MSAEDVMLSCPHCRREYKVRLDLAKLARVTSRASCARCKKVFEITAERIKPVDHARLGAQERVVHADSRRDTYHDTRAPRSVIERNSAVPGIVSDTPSGASRRADVPAVSPRKRGASIQPRTKSTDRPLLARTTSGERPVEPAQPPQRRTTPSQGTPPLPASGVAPLVVPTPTVSVAPPPAEVAPAPVGPVVPDVPPQEPDWLVRADPGLAALVTEQSEGCAALEWLLGR